MTDLAGDGTARLLRQTRDSMPLHKFTRLGVAYLTDTIKFMLSTTSPDGVTYVSGLTEATGTNYSRKTLASKTITESGGWDYYDADDVTWASLTSTFRYAVMIKDTGSDATSVIMGYYDLGSQNVINDSAILQFSALGIFRERVSA